MYEVFGLDFFFLGGGLERGYYFDWYDIKKKRFSGKESGFVYFRLNNVRWFGCGRFRYRTSFFMSDICLLLYMFVCCEKGLAVRALRRVCVCVERVVDGFRVSPIPAHAGISSGGRGSRVVGDKKPGRVRTGAVRGRPIGN